MGVKKTININFMREDCAEYGKIYVYVKNTRSVKLINYGEKWEVMENRSGIWENIGLSGIDLKYLKERVVRYLEDKHDAVRYVEPKSEKPIWKIEGGREVFNLEAMNNWLVGNLTPLATLMPR